MRKYLDIQVLGYTNIKKYTKIFEYFFVRIKNSLKFATRNA